ncbi:MAG: tetratricopeptide repeat protein [Candidatus Saganbacteria bacterium]|nr:tetratricopeptide repeat protein [Candidatus Saganbacteria bacterium]
MKKISVFLVLILMLLASAALGLEDELINPEDLSLKAGPTEPGEELSLLWLESFVYPKKVSDDKIISLGVRLTSKINAVNANFDFSDDEVVLLSDDGMHWSGVYTIPENVDPGLHIVRYNITGNKGTITRTVEFFIHTPPLVADSTDQKAKEDTLRVSSWPLTVTSTCSAMVGKSIRVIEAGRRITGISKVLWYKVVLEDGSQGWLQASMVEEPVEDYYLLGYDAYKQKDYKTAIHYYKATININPQFIKGYFWLAKSYYRNDQVDLAYRKIMEAMRLDDRNIEVRAFATKLAREYFGIAREKLKEQRYNEALAAYQKVLNLKPDSAVSLIELGKCYVKLDMPEQARGAWREALGLEPHNKELHALLGVDLSNISLANISGVRSQRKLVQNELRQVKTLTELPPKLVDDSLALVRNEKTRKGTKVGAAIKSVVALTKSLGTPVVEKGWETKKQGDKYLVRYLCEQGAGVIESFEWLVDVDSKRVSASNNNSQLLMERW